MANHCYTAFCLCVPLSVSFSRSQTKQLFFFTSFSSSSVWYCCLIMTCSDWVVFNVLCIMWSFVKFFYLKYNKPCSTPLPTPTPTHCHIRDNSLKTAVNSCNCTTYNASNLARHAAGTLISTLSIIELCFTSQSLINSFESCSAHLSALHLPPPKTFLLPIHQRR